MTEQALAALELALGKVYFGASADDAQAVADQLDDLGYTVTDNKQDR